MCHFKDSQRSKVKCLNEKRDKVDKDNFQEEKKKLILMIFTSLYLEDTNVA